jgi:tRNA pseudouridine38-40 synthase
MIENVPTTEECRGVEQGSDSPRRTLRGIKLIVSYDGTQYLGWQAQKTGGRTIQNEVQRVASQIAGEQVTIHASGRTDAGVHAIEQAVSFQTHANHPPEIWLRAFAGFLPYDISVVDVSETPPEFHARKHAIRKRYRYLLHDGSISEIFAKNYLWQTRRPLDLAAMQQASKALIGKHDFFSFQSGGSRRRTTVRTVYELKLWRPFDSLEKHSQDWRHYPQLLNPQNLIALEIEADGFLYNMVRTIIGTLVQVGTHKQPIDWPVHVLAARDRRAAGKTAPAQGLYLQRVIYPAE